MKRPFFLLRLLAVGLIPLSLSAQTPAPRSNDVNTPLHLLKPDYPVPYGTPQPDSVVGVLRRVHSYLDAVTPPEVVNRQTGQVITDFARFDPNATLKPGDFRLTSYEWGVTYAGMLLASEATGDPRFAGYTNRRLNFLADITPYFRKGFEADPKANSPLRSVLTPHALDDAGAIAAAAIKATRAGGVKTTLRPLIDNYLAYISNKEFRLPDGTLARNRPQPNTLWLDDLFMAVPALAQMGKLTGERRYFDDAVKQVTQFSARMFNPSTGLFMHGWVQGMAVHPEFRWARANGWAVMTLVELLDVLPADHPGRARVLELLKAHAKGLAAYQSGSGFWHQLLDRP
ncbi:MAG: glycoside hydrolase family 88 protein, partial [Sphingobacteriaceae bacterium]|nr:glycoside hydrolase family 88 protein [Cytophagaceae bacterium]